MLSVYAGSAGSGKTFLSNMFAKNYVAVGQNVLFVKDPPVRETFGPYVADALERGEPLLQVVSTQDAFAIIEMRTRENRVGTIIIDDDDALRGHGTFPENQVAMQRRVETLSRAARFGNVFVFAQTHRGSEEIAAPRLLSYSADQAYRLSAVGPPEAREVRAVCVKNLREAIQGTAAIFPINLSALGLSTPIVRPTISVALYTKIELIRLDLLELEAGRTLEPRT